MIALLLALHILLFVFSFAFTAGAGMLGGRIARTVVLKLKTSDFQTLTRSLTPSIRPRSAEELADLACALRERSSGAAAASSARADWFCCRRLASLAWASPGVGSVGNW